MASYAEIDDAALPIDAKAGSIYEVDHILIYNCAKMLQPSG